MKEEYTRGLHKYIIVLDSKKGKAYQHNTHDIFDENAHCDLEEALEEYGYDINNIQWMECKKPIQIIK